MRFRRLLGGAIGAVALIAPVVAVGSSHPAAADRRETVRFATFNASLNRGSAGQLVADLTAPGNAQADAVATIIQKARPDVLLINEFDFAPEAVDLFRENYLEVSQNGAQPIHYPYAFIAPSNTGIATGFDLNNNGVIVTTPGAPGYGDDAFGFGAFPGQFGMVVYSKYPIIQSRVRTFQFFRWKDMPGNLMPIPFYSPEEVAILRLSSKSHWDLPIRIRGKTVHFLVSHPTPPVFDGPEDRNGTRNHNEIRFWADYISGGRQASYIYDDSGRRGGLKRGERFVIAGDQNSDPLDGDSIPGAIQQLLDNPRVNVSHTPESAGAVEASLLQGGANTTHRSDPRFDTADFSDSAPGNLRADYVLPDSGLRIWNSAVFWPVTSDPLFRLTGVFPFPSSDHRAVWVDVKVPGASAPSR